VLSKVMQFVNLMSCFPTGVAIVTTATADGALFGMTCSSVLSVTLSPPTLLVSLRTSSPTLGAICEREHFAVNLLKADGVHAAKVFSSPEKSRFSRVGWQESPTLGLPWLVDHALASADCQLSGTYAVGDHTLAFGQVAAIRQTAGRPLLYGQRRYSEFPPDEAI
jgi:flavin reductase (DIM6/NTAB) family NADH-FMN oxidoreductase RutF